MLFFIHLCLLQAALSQSPINLCFHDHASELCTAFIADKRHITVSEAKALRRRALALYLNEESSPFAVYDRSTVAVACLASNGILRPGPDSDCAACSNACTQESRPEVCQLYCTSSFSQTTQRKGWTSRSLNENRTTLPFQSLIDENPTRLEELTARFNIPILVLGGGLAIVLLILIIGAIFIWVKTKPHRTHRQERHNCGIDIGGWWLNKLGGHEKRGYNNRNF